MTRTAPWFTALCICILEFGCAHDADEPSHDKHPASNAMDDASIDAGSPEPDAQVAREPVDQTPPTGANGLAFDAAGKLWIADLFGKQVLRVDPGSGEILARFNENASGPDDVAIDERGRVFWTDWPSGKVGRIDPKTGQNEIIATLPTGANSIAFNADGRLFVGLVILNRGLYELDPEGMREPQLVTAAIGSFNAFEFGPDGFLWGPVDGAVTKLKPEGGEVVETITMPGYASVRYGERERALFAVANGKQGMPPRLDKIDPDDHSVTQFAEVQLASIDNFMIGPTGEFFVTAFDQPQFAVIHADGSAGAVVKIGAESAP